MGDSLLVVSLGSGATIAGPIVAGENHTCARLSDGTVKCWGHSLYGQVGLGDTSDHGDAAGEMGDVIWPSGAGEPRAAWPAFAHLDTDWADAMPLDGEVIY